MNNLFFLVLQLMFMSSCSSESEDFDLKSFKYHVFTCDAEAAGYGGVTIRFKREGSTGGEAGRDVELPTIIFKK